MLVKLMIHQLYHLYLQEVSQLLHFLHFGDTELAEKTRNKKWELEWQIDKEKGKEYKLDGVKIKWASNRPCHYNKHEKLHTT